MIRDPATDAAQAKAATDPAVLGQRVSAALYAARGRADALVRVRRELAHLFAPEVAALARTMTGRPAARGRNATIERLVDHLLDARCQRLGVVVRGRVLGGRDWVVGTVVQPYRLSQPSDVLVDLRVPLLRPLDPPVHRVALTDVTPYDPEVSP